MIEEFRLTANQPWRATSNSAASHRFAPRARKAGPQENLEFEAMARRTFGFPWAVENLSSGASK